MANTPDKMSNIEENWLHHLPVGIMVRIEYFIKFPKAEVDHLSTDHDTNPQVSMQEIMIITDTIQHTQHISTNPMMHIYAITTAEQTEFTVSIFITAA